jgi:MFS family permease
MAQTALESRIQDNSAWNFTVNLWDIMFITVASSLVARDTVMPALVLQLTDAKWVIGLIPAIFTLGFYLPQLFSANFSERMRFKKPFVAFVGGLGERVPYLLIAITLWALAGTNPTAALALFFLFLGVAYFSMGFATPAWYDMIAKVIGVNRRGLWSGLSHSLGAMLGVVAAVYVGRILDAYLFPDNFVLLFGLAFFFATISWVGLILNREPPSETVKESVPLVVYLRRLPAVLRRDRNYGRFLVSRSTVQLGTMAAAYYTAYGIERLADDGRGIGVLTGFSIGSVAVMNLVWGLIGDRYGHKLVLAGGAVCLVCAPLAAYFADSQTGLAIAFVLGGAYIAADMVSGLNIILEFCAPADRPTYIGLTNTLLAPVVTLAPLIGGWLATTGGYQPLFVTASVIAVCGALLLIFWVREPRHNGTVGDGIT